MQWSVSWSQLLSTSDGEVQKQLLDGTLKCVRFNLLSVSRRAQRADESFFERSKSIEIS